MSLSRREFIGVVAAAPVVAVAAMTSTHDGLPDQLHAESYRQYFAKDEDVEVTLDGVVITTRCTAANRAEGWVDLIPELKEWHSAWHVAPVRRYRGAVTFRRIRT